MDISVTLLDVNQFEVRKQ